jgi:ubiquinone/menaquinone biosynthesis C-methylase UbiE
MSVDMYIDIEDLARAGLNKYTRKAFRMLPPLDRPCILDVGCGRGVPTMELARLSQGQVTGLDIHQPSLEAFKQKIEAAGLSHRVRAVNCSMFYMNFPDETFDIIWSEGSISTLGFQKGLKEWRRFIKPNGFLVVHEGINKVPGKPDQVITHYGYNFIGQFTLSADTWWSEYYAPMEKQTREPGNKYTGNPGTPRSLDQEQRETCNFKKYCGKKKYGICASIFLVMQKK